MSNKFRLREIGGKLKIQHTILDSLKPVLNRLLKSTPGILTLIPGSIKPVADAHGTQVKVRVTIPVAKGFKAIAFTNGARQELFVNTKLTQSELQAAFKDAIAA